MSESYNSSPGPLPEWFDFGPDERTFYLRMGDNYGDDPLAWNLHWQSLAEAIPLIRQRDEESAQYCERLREGEAACRLLELKDQVELGRLTEYPGEDNGWGLSPR